MYLNTTIKIPEIKGKIITKKKGTTTYILYQYGSEYRPEKQYSVPLRTIVGKISSSDSTLMIPNEKFQSYFPDVKLPEELPLAYRSCCLKIGSCIIIQKILNEYKLIPMLKKRFGVHWIDSGSCFLPDHRRGKRGTILSGFCFYPSSFDR